MQINPAAEQSKIIRWSVEAVR